MKSRLFAGALGAGLLAFVTAIALAAPAAAQTGGVRGKIIDEAGKPVQDAAVVLSSPEGLGDANLKTDAKGEFFRIGMRPGDYTVKVTKGALKASLARFHVGIGDPSVMEPLTLRAGGGDLSGNKDADDAMKKKQTELQNLFKDGRSQMDEGKFDEAIATYTKILTDVPKCAQCYVGMGDVYLKKGALPEAEAAYTQLQNEAREAGELVETESEEGLGDSETGGAEVRDRYSASDEDPLVGGVEDEEPGA